MNSNIAMENGIISLHNVILNGVANNMFSVLNPLTTEHVTKSSQCLRSHLITTIPLPWSQWNASSAASAMMEVFPHPDSPWTTRGCLLSPNTYSLIFWGNNFSCISIICMLNSISISAVRLDIAKLVRGFLHLIVALNYSYYYVSANYN